MTPAFLSPTSVKPRIATPLLVFLRKTQFHIFQEFLDSTGLQVTSAIAKLFRDFATLRPASEPLSRPNPLEGEAIWFYFLSPKEGKGRFFSMSSDNQSVWRVFLSASWYAILSIAIASTWQAGSACHPFKCIHFPRFHLPPKIYQIYSAVLSLKKIFLCLLFYDIS